MYPVPYDVCYRVLAIDPSTSATGFSVLDHNVLTQETHIAFASTVFRKDLLKRKDWIATVHGERSAAVAGYGEALADLLRYWSPTLVIAEAPYLSRLPAAFKALVEVQTSLRLAVMEFDPTLPFETVDPARAKQNIGVSGKSGDKEAVAIAVRARPGLYTVNGVDLNQIDEHSMDSIAVGLYHIDTYVKQCPW